MEFTSNKYQDTLDFEVVKKPLYIEVDSQYIKDITRVAIVNTSNNQIISHMSPSYALYDNKSFMNLANRISETFDIKLGHYSIHNHGERVLAAFEKTNKKHSIGNYTFDNHIVLYDSRDGSTKLNIGSTGRLHRCDNMFKSTNVQYGINHNSKLQEKIEEFANVLNHYDIDQKAYLNRLNALQNVKVSREVMHSLISNWVDLPVDQITSSLITKDDSISTRKMNIISGFDSAYLKESNDLGETGFTIWNAVTNYYTHNRNKTDIDLFFSDFGKKEAECIKFLELV